jgi:hypothetical protein
MSGYSAAWERLRRFRRQFLWAWLGYVPIGFGVAYLGFLVTRSFVVGWIAAVALMLLFLAIGIRFQSFPCPRCGEPFFGRRGTFFGLPWASNNVFRRTCGSCGLRKYAEA